MTLEITGRATGMVKRAGAALTALVLLAAAPPAEAAAAETGQAMSAAAKPALVAPDFAVPTLVQAPGFKLVPLGPALVKVDFDAYMSSVEHLQKTFTRSPDWPHAGISDADAMTDMETESARFQARTSFAYSVLTPDGKRERV